VRSRECGGRDVKREDQLRGGVSCVVAEVEVLAVERDEGIGEHEDDDERDAEQNDDEEKVWLLRG